MFLCAHLKSGTFADVLMPAPVYTTIYLLLWKSSYMLASATALILINSNEDDNLQLCEFLCKRGRVISEFGLDNVPS